MAKRRRIGVGAGRAESNPPAELWALPPVDAARFKFAFAHVAAAAALKAPAKNPENFSFRVEDDATGDPKTYHFTDNPMNRAMIALKEHFAQGLEYMSAGARFFAFGDLLRDGVLENFVRDDLENPGSIEVHEAVIEVLAVFPLNSDLKFDLRSFLNAVERRAAEIDATEAANR